MSKQMCQVCRGAGTAPYNAFPRGTCISSESLQWTCQNCNGAGWVEVTEIPLPALTIDFGQLDLKWNGDAG